MESALITLARRVSQLTADVLTLQREVSRLRRERIIAQIDDEKRNKLKPLFKKFR